MIRVIPQSKNGEWETQFDNTSLCISFSKGRYRATIITTTAKGGFGFSTRRTYLNDLIAQINIYLKNLNGDRIILIVSKASQDLYLSTVG